MQTTSLFSKFAAHERIKIKYLLLETKQKNIKEENEKTSKKEKQIMHLSFKYAPMCDTQQHQLRPILLFHFQKRQNYKFRNVGTKKRTQPCSQTIICVLNAISAVCALVTSFIESMFVNGTQQSIVISDHTFFSMVHSIPIVYAIAIQYDQWKSAIFFIVYCDRIFGRLGKSKIRKEGTYCFSYKYLWIFIFKRENFVCSKTDFDEIIML